MGTDSDNALIRVEVAYATPARQSLLSIEVTAGCTVAEAIAQSGIHELYPEIQQVPEAVGVFSQKVTLEHRLNQGDRVEIYRPLLADPKEMRKQRAQKKP